MEFNSKVLYTLLEFIGNNNRDVNFPHISEVFEIPSLVLARVVAREVGG